jgi:two-component system phosphate regulon response regulator PhoB
VFLVTCRAGISNTMQTTRYRVLVAGSDEQLRHSVGGRLAANEVDVVEASDPASVVSTMGQIKPDFVILSLSGYSALDTIRDVRTVSRAPLLALCDDATDGVDAIDAGADDYVRMPCSPREIAARTRSALRRRRWSDGAEPTLDFGELVIRREARDVLVATRSIAMPAREFQLLEFLASHDRVYTRTELLESVWNASPDWLGVRTVTEHVRRVRQRLYDAGTRRRWIRTVHGVGYRFDPDAV